MRSTPRHALICIALIAPGAAMAEGSILSRPSECSAVLTVQKHGCEVETQLSCGKGDSAYWRSEIFDSDGLSGVSHSDSNYRQLEVQTADGRGGVVIDQTKSYADSPLDIIATGGGVSLEFGTLMVMGLKKPISESTLLKSEPDLEISGRSLHRFSTTITVQYPPPVPEVNGAGMVYFDQPTGVLFTGERQMEWPPSDGKILHSPAAIIMPGETGFDEPHPIYDCGNLSFNHSDVKAYQA